MKFVRTVCFSLLLASSGVFVGCSQKAPTPQQGPTPTTQLAPVETFKDCPDCPVMVVVPPGRFLMGRTDSDKFDVRWATPQHEVVIDRNFAVGKYEVTYGQFTKFVRETEGDSLRKNRRNNKECRGNKHYGPSDPHPVTCVDLQDARDYAQWLAKKTGKPYRLLSEAEWEYAARAGTTTVYWWGDDESDVCIFAQVLRCGAKGSALVGQYPPNPFGLHDMLGNVTEWVEDCWNSDYTGAPADGSAWMGERCHNISRGNAWTSQFWEGQSAAVRSQWMDFGRAKSLGFRVATTLP